LGSQLAAAKPKGFPQRKARPFLWKNRRLVVLRSVVLPPRPGEALELLEPFLFFEKGRWGRKNGPEITLFFKAKYLAWA
jgi:hypothetical protein